MTYDIEHTGVEERSDFGQPMTMQDHHDGTHTHDIGYDIGHLISESSYQITDSPWTSPKHFYSGAGSDRSKCATARSDLLKEGRKENVPIVMSKDAFRPVEIPNTKAEKRTSSLTSLLASDFSWVSPSSRNDEKRRQQYGDSDALDSVAIHPGIGENVLNMSKVMSSGRTKRSVPIPIDDEDNSTVHRTAPPFICGESDDPDYYVHDLDSHDALGEPDSAAIGNRNYTSQNAFQSNPQIINENVHWNELRNDSAIYDSEDDETAAQSAIFRNILESQNRHMESRRIANQQAVSYDASTTPGSGLHRNASSTLLSECEVKLRAVASFNSVLPLSSRETKGMSSRKTHPPLVSAMRNKSVSSTETAVAR